MGPAFPFPQPPRHHSSSIPWERDSGGAQCITKEILAQGHAPPLDGGHRAGRGGDPLVAVGVGQHIAAPEEAVLVVVILNAGLHFPRLSAVVEACRHPCCVLHGIHEGESLKAVIDRVTPLMKLPQDAQKQTGVIRLAAIWSVVLQNSGSSHEFLCESGKQTYMVQFVHGKRLTIWMAVVADVIVPGRAHEFGADAQRAAVRPSAHSQGGELGWVHPLHGCPGGLHHLQGTPALLTD